MNIRSVNQREAEFFQANGWAYLPNLVDVGSASYLLSQGESALAANPGAGEFGAVVERNFRAFRGEGRESAIARELMLSAVMGANAARLLDLPRVRLWADGYMLKTPESEGVHDDTVYHQDFPGNPVDRSGFLTVWVALHDMPAEAGVMQFYSRSHRLGVMGQVFADGIDLRRRCPALKECDLSPPLDLKAGDATVHHSLTVHGAPPNRSPRNRWGYTIIYMDAESRYTASPGLMPEGVSLEPFAVFDHPAFPLIAAS